MTDTADAAATPVPTARQLEYQSWEMGLFLHFGIRTFYEGHRDWDGRPMDPAAFNPTQLDCDQWMRTARAAGMRYAVMTAKHHDGFALWPSAYTDYSVAASPWRSGKGDVVREYVDACRRHGIEPGLYYSPAQHRPGADIKDMADPKAYDDYFIHQISELLGGDYGQISVLWFDGCGSENHEYDWARIIGEIRRMQPNILIFSMGDPDFRWVGNELGFADVPSWNVAEHVPISVRTDRAEATAKPTWLPVECDIRLRHENWFYSEYDVHTVKPLEELLGIYDYSVGRGANLLINVGPDRRGLLPEVDAARLVEFGEAVRRRFAKPIVTLKDFERVELENGHVAWDVRFEGEGLPPLINHVVIEEDLSRGERVRRWALRVVPPYNLRPVTLHEGRQIGHRAIARLAPFRAQQIRLEVLEADAEPTLTRLELHHTFG